MEHVNGSARWWLCACLKSVSGMRTFSRGILVFDMVIKYCSDINERNWLQLLFYIIVLMGKIASIIGMIFFHLCFRLKFSRNAVSWERVQLESKTDLTTTGMFLEFFVGILFVSSTSYLHGLKSA